MVSITNDLASKKGTDLGEETVIHPFILLMLGNYCGELFGAASIILWLEIIVKGIMKSLTSDSVVITYRDNQQFPRCSIVEDHGIFQSLSIRYSVFADSSALFKRYSYWSQTFFPLKWVIDSTVNYKFRFIFLLNCPTKCLCECTTHYLPHTLFTLYLY